MESTVVHSVPTAHQRSISCHLATEALVSQEKTECRKYASNDQQTSTQLHVTEEDQDYVSEETVVVPGEEYSLESFNLLEGNEIQIHDEFVINDVNVTNQDVPAQNVRPPKRLKISDTDEVQSSVQSPQETGLLTVEGNIDFEPSHEKIQIASAPQPMDEDDLTLDELNNALGPNWYEKSDEVLKHLHELLSFGELPKEHICY